MRTRAIATLFVVLLASVVFVEAGIGGPRKLLQYGRRYGRRYDSGTAQLAANQAALVNTQYAIRDAVESGANPYVTRAAANYGNDQAWWAANYRNYYRPYYWGWGKK